MKDNYVKKILSGKWLVPETLSKNLKWITLFIVLFIITIYQQYRVDVLYVKNMKLKQNLKITRTEFIYSSVELMNTTLEATIINKTKERIPQLKPQSNKVIKISTSNRTK